VAIAAEKRTTTNIAKDANAKTANSNTRVTSVPKRSRASAPMQLGRVTRTAMMATTTLVVIGMVAIAVEPKTTMVSANSVNVWTAHTYPRETLASNP